MNKKFSLLLLISILSALNINAEVYEGSCGADGDNVKYSLDTETGVLKISGTGAMEDFEWNSNYYAYITPWRTNKSYIQTVEITDGVTSIGNHAFSNCSGLASTTIPQSVKRIGDWSFSNCSNLKSIGIPNSITSIGSSAFYGCEGLTSITIPSSVTTIGEKAFCDCSNLKSIGIPNSVTLIGHWAFYNTAWLNNQPDGMVYAGKVAYQYKGTMPENTSITLEEGTSSIAGNAFSSCTGLTSVIIPNSVTSIGNGAFSECSDLTEVTIGNNVTSIGDHVFNGCPNLTFITIPNRVTSIGNYAFSSCSGLSSVTIPNSVTSIGNYAFSSCSGLSSVTIPNSVTSIGNGAFSGCYIDRDKFINNSSLDAEANNYWECNVLDSREAGFWVSKGTLLKYVGSDSSITIPSSVTSIGSGAFSMCKCLTTITIPRSVTSIGDRAFYNCSNLSSVSISNSVTSIGESTFYNCSSLISVTIPNSVTSIGDYAFQNCSSLISVIIPNSVTDKGYRSFYGCTGLSKVTLNNNMITSKSYSTNSSIGSIFGNQVKEYVLGENVTSIGKNAFYNCSGMTSVTIPNSVTSIGEGAFYGCSGLNKVILNNNAVASKSYSSNSTIGSVFGNQVKEYVLGENVTSIGENAFYNCTNVNSLKISDNVTSVGENAFDGTAWYNNLPDGLFYAGKIAYRYKGTMPENTSMIIKEGTVKLNDNLFDGCTGLSTLYIPSSVKSIGNKVLANCTELLDVYCYARKSPTMGTRGFDNSGIQFATLYVPEASLNGYKVTEPWSGFGNIQTLSGDYPEIPETIKCATPTIKFENGKVSFSCETEGVKYVCNFSTPSASYEEGVEVGMPEKLQIFVYAKKDGFENSDVATKEIDLGAAGLRGDLNGDGVVNMPDAMFIVNKVLKGKFPDE